MSNNLSRRDFLKVVAGSAAAAIAANAMPLATVVAAKQSTYNEAPMLADLVAAGALSPVDERLPIFVFVARLDLVGPFVVFHFVANVL